MSSRILATVFALACSASADETPAAPPLDWTTIEGSKGAGPAIRSAAAGTTKTPVLFVGATWCGSCKAYKASLGDPTMVAAHKAVHIIEVDADRHMRVIQALPVAPAGVPHWSILDHDGRPTGRFIDGSAMPIKTAATMAPILAGFFEGDPQHGTQTNDPTSADLPRAN